MITLFANGSRQHINTELHTSLSLFYKQTSNMDLRLHLTQHETELFLFGVLCFFAALLVKNATEAATRARQAAPAAGRVVRRRPNGRRNRVWVRQWLARRELHGAYDTLLQELNREDPQGHKNFVRIYPELFADMVTRLTPLLQKKDTRFRKSLAVGLKLAVTLRHLASGNDYASLEYTFRVSRSAVSKFVPLVCDAIIKTYGPEFLKCPTNADEWKEVAKEFSAKWNYHNCIGALDGKHVGIKKPKGGGSFYFNYKKFHSIVLMALSSASYKFIYVNIGAEGGAGDGGTWQMCGLARALAEGRAGLPDDTHLPHDDEPIPFHIVADDAFALKTNLMKPYSHQSQDPTERLYSYRLSRARRVVENSFGLLQTRWRIFGTTLQQRVDVCKKIVMAGCVMHNICLHHYPHTRTDVDHEDNDHNVVAGAWREEAANLMADLMSRRGERHSVRAKAVRDYLARYYTSDVGAVEWQERMVFPRGRIL